MRYRSLLRATFAALAIFCAACSAGKQDQVSGSGGAPGSGGSGFGTGGISVGSMQTGTGGKASGTGGTGSGRRAGGTGGSGGDGMIGTGGMNSVASDAGGSARDAGGGTEPATNVCTGADMSGTAPSTLSVDVDSAQPAISNGIFGLLMERLGRDINGGLYVGGNPSTANMNGIRNDIIDGFKEAGVGMIEWPGGCAANNYNWQPPNPSNDMGTDQYMQLSSILGIEPYLAGPGTASAADASLQWLTHVNDNPDHPDWSVKYFKIGNEVWGCGGNQDEAAYETNYLANYDKLSAPINGKKVSLVAGTGLIGNMTWLDTELKNLGSKIDAIEVHDYIYHPSDIPCVGFSDAQYYTVVHAANQGQIGPRVTAIAALLDKYDSAKRIKIFEDEWGDWLEPFNKADDGWLQQITVMDAISTAEQLHIFMQHADRVQMAGLAQAVNVIHSLFLTRKSDGVLVKTPAFYVFKMFLPHHSSNAKWAPNTLTSENINGNNTMFPVISAASTVDSEGRVNISLANVDLTNTRMIDITLNSAKSSYIVSSAQVVTGPAKDTFNDFAQPEKVNIQDLDGSSCSISGKSLEITLPSKSVVMLVLTPQ
jgi:alpha-N-arabinofuranosidase